MNKTINIKAIKNNNGWFNITTVDGQEISVNSQSNPNLTLQLEKQPISLELNLIEKNGKFFGWDIKEPAKGGFKQLSPEQIKAKQDREDATQRMIIAQSSISSAANYYAQRRDGDTLNIIAMANDFYNFVILKSKEQ